MKESQGENSVNFDVARTVDIPQTFDARQYGMSADTTEFLADGTVGGVDQVEKVDQEHIRRC